MQRFCLIAVDPPVNWLAERNVLRGLDRLRVRPGERRGLDVGAAHAFSQWQACLWSALCLNQLLLLPEPEPHLSWQVNGDHSKGDVKRTLKCFHRHILKNPLFVPGCSAGPWCMASPGISRRARLLNLWFLEALWQLSFTGPCWRRLGSAAPRSNNSHPRERGAGEDNSEAGREEVEEEERAEGAEGPESSVTCLQP